MEEGQSFLRGAEVFLQFRDVNAQDRQALRPVVVHLPGDPAALLLLGMKQPGGKLPKPFLSLAE
jgi:hypothetical protein